MKRTGQSCLSNFAAVQTCCVVTVRLLQTRYFQYCPFVLPVCQAGTLPESRKTSTKMSETVLHENIIIHRFNWQKYCFVQNRKQQTVALQSYLISYILLSSLFPRKCADTRNSLSDHKQQPKGNKQEDLTLSKTSWHLVSFWHRQVFPNTTNFICSYLLLPPFKNSTEYICLVLDRAKAP